VLLNKESSQFRHTTYRFDPSARLAIAIGRSAIVLSRSFLMTQAAFSDSKAQILQSFQQILNQRKQLASKVATKEEEAEKAKNQELLEVASTYTSDSIVRSLAEVQLDFGNIVTDLSQRLETEAGKLEELQRAIAIESQNLERFQQIRTVADTLDILRQEHREKLRNLENNIASQQEALEKEQVEQRKAWQKEQQNYEIALQELNERIAKQRQQELEDYNYHLERQRAIDADEYEREKLEIERELANIEREKEKDWAAREKFLTDNQAVFEENRQKAEGYEEELKQAYRKAKEEAIQEVNRDAKVKADLFDKEWQGTKQGYELKIQSMQQTLQRQDEQIAELSAQLQAATSQARDLALRAFDKSSNESRSQ
jgi:hypothetical protein